MSGNHCSERRHYYLDAMGIQSWVLRTAGHPATPGQLDKTIQSGFGDDQQLSCAPVAQAEPPPEPAIDRNSAWQTLKAGVESCTTCGLHKTRIQTVFGVGDQNASWMVVGEAPGANEDQQGEPFVGKAGMLLNEMLRAMGLERSQVYIANILKCRPPKNRDPNLNEVDSCEPFLKQQLALVKPKIILAVGRVAAQNLLKTDAPIGKLRAKRHYYGEIPVVVIYHPAYLLRSPLEKRRAWEDLRFALNLFQEHTQQL